VLRGVEAEGVEDGRPQGDAHRDLSKVLPIRDGAEPELVSDEERNRQAENVDRDEKEPDEPVATKGARTDPKAGRAIHDPTVGAFDDAREVHRATIVDLGEDDDALDVLGEPGRCIP
jgi:hypothetical protein